MSIQLPQQPSCPEFEGLTASLGAPPTLGLASGAHGSPVDLGNLPNYALFVADGSSKAKIEGAPGFYGDIAVDGVGVNSLGALDGSGGANTDSAGTVPYAGTIYTNDNLADFESGGKWDDFVNANPATASVSPDQTALINGLEADLAAAWADLDGRTVTDASINTLALLSAENYQNGIAETIVVDITSGFNPKTQIPITGDADDMFVIRWGKTNDPSTSYGTEVKFADGGAIVPVSEL